jgi:hypothetical protein
MFRKWYLSRMESELAQLEAQLAQTKARAASAPAERRAEHDRMIVAAEDKARDVRLRLEELRDARREHYAELKRSFELAREGFAASVRGVRRFA